jgi:polar amino acid transport system substrate-binding protein
VAKAGRYFEQNNQELQVTTLQEGRYDVVLSDRSIFHYNTLLFERRTHLVPKPTQEHSFVTPNPRDYRGIFRDAKIRDDFEAGLKQLKATGRYQAIFDKYLK